MIIEFKLLQIFSKSFTGKIIHVVASLPPEHNSGGINEYISVRKFNRYYFSIIYKTEETINI